MVNLGSYKNTQQVSARLNQLNKVPEATFISSTASALPEVTSLVLVLILYTKKDHQRVTKLFMDLFLKGN